ncbi:MAG: DUF3365 domain-containing protein [Proteobacteria bacterium]|nr:DUF3365 domain-containing protein [Pseudomonadota bacterium]
MTETSSKDSQKATLIRNCIFYTVSWTLICLFATYWNVAEIKDKSLDLAQKEARTILDKDQALRYWATDHKGVYVPATEATPPNPYLSHIPERDLLTPSGLHLTLMNPSYMLRQVMDRYGTLYNNKGHITSLNTLNPINKPDQWETSALQAFETGKLETSAYTELDGQEYFRLMKPMFTKPGCLGCHAQQGYKEGDVRGGVSVSIPLAPYRKMETDSLRSLYSTHLFFWATGLFIISLSFYRSIKRLAQRLAGEKLLQEQSEKIQLFAYSVAHDLKNPVIAIHALARVMNKRHLDGLDLKSRQYCEQIEKSAEQVSALVDQINAFISSKEQPLQKAPLDFLEICQTVRAENDHRLRERIIIWSEPLQVGVLEADRLVILRIIRNLVDNALKYGGETLSRITITYEESASLHTIRVINDGRPIAPEDCQNIFQRYKRHCSDSAVEGTGLGLAIVRELVDLHGGQVWVESDGRQGVTFSFTITKNLVDSQIRGLKRKKFRSS